MKKFIKGALRVLLDYTIAVILFVVFIYTFFNHLKGFSFVIFILFAMLLYSDMNEMAVKEKRPQYNMKPFPLKGLIYGLLGFSPYILAEIIYPFINFGDETANKIKHLVLNTLLSPLYDFYKLGNEKPLAYAIASLIVPVIAMLGYLAGYYGFRMRGRINKNGNANKEQKTIR